MLDIILAYSIHMAAYYHYNNGHCVIQPHTFIVIYSLFLYLSHATFQNIIYILLFNRRVRRRFTLLLLKLLTARAIY